MADREPLGDAVRVNNVASLDVYQMIIQTTCRSRLSGLDSSRSVASDSDARICMKHASICC